MTRVLWAMIKEHLLFPFLEMDLDYYDLHVKHRDDTEDRVTIDAATAVETAWRRRQMRHHYPQCGPRSGVRPEKGMEKPERHHPRDSGRDRFQGADSYQKHRPFRAELDPPYRCGPSRLRRCL